MQEKADARKNAQLEYDREKALIDEVVQRIEDEDALESEIKRSKQAETKAFIVNFLEEREQLRQDKIRKVPCTCNLTLMILQLQLRVQEEIHWGSCLKGV